MARRAATKTLAPAPHAPDAVSAERPCRNHPYPSPTENRNPALVCGEVVDDRVRPAYPVDLFRDVLSYGRPDIDGRLASDVGAGTGRATEAFAREGRRALSAADQCGSGMSALRFDAALIASDIVGVRIHAVDPYQGVSPHQVAPPMDSRQQFAG
ncbi:hypothetical protein GCM10010172_35070 [Paractinoplanes ferrugineus]|uniref:Uncharacterized protein n=1 Tax=Paractinoplanes ferrugineus TaxID=113564 RepID=A0A919MK56_9ACTN|nr:hypothetical protein Afe05nite_72600 [Actinoplanes ferrugineus]